MSHAHGEVWQGGRIVAHFEYDGTSDIAISCLHETAAEVDAEWRRHDWKDCTCGAAPVEVALYSSYGGGFHWPSQICLDCRAIVGEREPYTDDIKAIDGRPGVCCAGSRGEALRAHSWGDTWSPSS